MNIVKRGLIALAVTAAVGGQPGVCWRQPPVPVPPVGVR